MYPLTPCYRFANKNVFDWAEKNNYLTKPVYKEQPSTRIDNITEQVDPELIQLAMESYENEEISAGKLAEFCFTGRKTIEDYLKAP